MDDPDDGHVTLFRCTRCPNLLLKDYDLPAHRAFHKEEKDARAAKSAAKKKKQDHGIKRPGPASRTLPGRKAKMAHVADSVASSDLDLVTLFERHEEAVDKSQKGGRQAMLNKKQLDKMRHMIVDEPVDDDEDPDSASSRRHRALRKSLKHSPIYRMKFNSG